MVALIIAVIAALITVSVESAKAGMEAREHTKDRVRMMMYTPVYIDGISFEALKAKYPSEHKNHPVLFRQYYDEMKANRDADLEAGNHPLSHIIEDRDNTNRLILFVLLIGILVYNEIV